MLTTVIGRGVCALNPYYYFIRSEGPAQVFLIVLVWMLSAFTSLTRKQLKKITLSYDKVARSPLPLPGQFSHIWMDVKKIIDTLHIANHKDKTCHELYSPEMLKKENPDMNTCAVSKHSPGSRITKGSFHPCPKHTIIFICTEWSGVETVTPKSVMLMDIGHCCQTIDLVV